MALNNMGLGFVFTARNLATGTITRLRGQLTGLGNQSRLTGMAMKAGFAIAAGGVVNLIAGLALLGGAFALAGAAGRFEQQMSLVGALANASGERLERLRNAAIEAGLATKFSPDEAVEGLRNLITAGLDAEQAATALTPSLQVATFGMISVADAGAAVVGSMNAFRREGLSAQQIADRLATAMARTNFQAADFAIGLSAVTAQAGIANQTLDTTLVGMGLLRNLNIQASRAATGLREAIRRLSSDQRSQAEAQRLLGEGGIFSDNGQGRMRNVLEIMHDLGEATQDLTGAQRGQALASILGARGVQLFAAVQGAEFRRTLADGTTEILRGIDAARELERQMRESAGMADMLQRAVSEGNYAGVVDVLKGVGQTFLVEVGRPIAEVLIPVIVGLKDGMVALTRFVNRLPMPVKRFGAALLLLSGVLLTGSGVAGLFVAALVLIIPVIKIVAIVVLGLAAAMAPFIVAMGAAIAVIAMFRQAVRLNVGGIVDHFTNAYNRVRLVVRAMTQLFSQGGFSGEIREEMNRAENQGIRNFVISVFRIVARVREFFNGIHTGFSRVVTSMAPLFEQMVKAFQELGEAFGFAGDRVGDLANTDMNSWAETGARVGSLLADTLGFIVRGITTLARVWTGFVGFFSTTWKKISGPFGELGSELSSLGSEISQLFTDMGVAMDGGEDGAVSFGELMGTVFSGILRGVIAVVRAVVWLMRTFVALESAIVSAPEMMSDGFRIMAIRINNIFINMVQSIQNSLDSILVSIGQALSRIPAGLRPQGLNSVIGAGAEAQKRIQGRREGAAFRARAEVQSRARIASGGRTAAFEAEAGERNRARREEMAAVVAALTQERKRDQAEATRPINVNIDGETVATAVAGADRRAGARGFTPVPADS
jgi:TP901 family phage tail tape measure protein